MVASHIAIDRLVQLQRERAERLAGYMRAWEERWATERARQEREEAHDSALAEDFAREVEKAGVAERPPVARITRMWRVG